MLSCTCVLSLYVGVSDEVCTESVVVSSNCPVRAQQ